jgi:hypothetical protein
MKRTVEITTPIPTADRVAERLGVSKARQRTLRAIVDGQFRATRGNTKVGALRHPSGDALLKGHRK